MANVNLYGTQQTQKIENKRNSALGTLVFSVAVVLIAFASYGGIKVWGMQLDKKIAGVDAQVQASHADLTMTSEQSNEVHDTFLRLKYVSGRSASSVLPSFAGIEKNILNGVVLSSYDYVGGAEGAEGKKITIQGDAVSTDAILQQLERFRSSGAFSNVALESVGLSEEGFVLFTLNMGLAPVK